MAVCKGRDSGERDVKGKRRQVLLQVLVVVMPELVLKSGYCAIQVCFIEVSVSRRSRLGNSMFCSLVMILLLF